MRKGRGLKGMLFRRTGFGALKAPLWLVGLAGAAMAAVAGQAVGPVLAGSVTGTIGTTVEQTILLNTSGSGVNVQLSSASTSSPFTASLNPFSGTTGFDDGLGVVNDEGTSFTVAVETQVGQKGTLALLLENGSGAKANALLELSVPTGIDVEIEEESGTSIKVDEAQLGANRWLLTVDSANDDYLYIIVEPKDDLKPGFYTITGKIAQIGG